MFVFVASLFPSLSQARTAIFACSYLHMSFGDLRNLVFSPAAAWVGDSRHFPRKFARARTIERRGGAVNQREAEQHLSTPTSILSLRNVNYRSSVRALAHMRVTRLMQTCVYRITSFTRSRISLHNFHKYLRSVIIMLTVVMNGADVSSRFSHVATKTRCYPLSLSFSLSEEYRRNNLSRYTIYF